jgi:intracellular sulfur oxidation DsrE/DsrF family protein
LGQEHTRLGSPPYGHRLKPSGALAALFHASARRSVSSSTLCHAKMAKESGYLEDVVLLVYGRAIMAFNGAVGTSARPQQIAAMARKAQHAGVRIVLCRNSIEQMVENKRSPVTAAQLGEPPGASGSAPSQVYPKGAEGPLHLHRMNQFRWRHRRASKWRKYCI